MKIKDGYISKSVAGSYIVVPVGSRRFESIMTLSEGGAYLFEILKTGAERDELVQALCAEYDVDTATAEADTDEFIESLKSAGLIDER